MEVLFIPFIHEHLNINSKILNDQLLQNNYLFGIGNCHQAIVVMLSKMPPGLKISLFHYQLAVIS